MREVHDINPHYDKEPQPSGLRDYVPKFIPTNEACRPCYYSVMLGQRMFCRAENPPEPVVTKAECKYGEPMIESSAFLVPQSALLKACDGIYGKKRHN